MATTPDSHGSLVKTSQGVEAEEKDNLATDSTERATSPTSNTDNVNDTSNKESAKKAGPTFERDWRFWSIIATLCVIGLLSALENTVVTTSLPYIVAELQLGDNYIWITNVFFLTSAAVQPLFGQLANIFGRRWITLSIVALFTLGSGISGGASNGATVIAGRAIQGMGSGGINMIVDVIVSDLVPLRERGNYMSFVLMVYFVGMALGPYIGGAFAGNGTWRWVFWINLPIGGVSMIMILLFLRVKHNKEMTFRQKLKRIDYIGNLLLIASTVSVLYALTYGGGVLPWSSWRIIFPLVIGLVGLGIFMFYENLSFVKEPVVPPRLLGNRTSAAIFVMTFLNSALLFWILFFLPVYYQAVLGKSAARAGVLILPAIVIGIPGAAGAVLLLSKFGRYRPLHFIGFAIFTLGVGLFTLFDKDTPLVEIVIFEMIAAGGSGFVLNTLLPACQAQFEEKDQAATTAAWSFIRSFGSIWGVAIPAAVFNNRFAQLSYQITDPAAAAIFSDGGAYQHASASVWKAFPTLIQNQIIGVYSESLKRVWQIGIVFSGVSFLIVFIERETLLRTELETEFGLEKKKADDVELAKKREIGKNVGVKGSAAISEEATKS